MGTSLTNNKRVKEMYQNKEKEPVSCFKCKHLLVKFWTKLFKGMRSNTYFCKHYTNCKVSWNGMISYNRTPYSINDECDCKNHELKE